MPIRLQSGIQRQPRNRYGRQANGLLLRGVVIATYVTDDSAHPLADNTLNPPAAVYCDVLVMPAISGQRWFVLPNCLVTQDASGLHRGQIWKPRAATVDWNNGTLDIDGGSDPKSIDGDNVLVGFLNDNLSQPIILKALPHPAMDLGREDKELGRRMRLKLEDGDPSFWRHHGVYGGVDTNGNYVIDSTFANDGTIDDEGKEPDPPTDGKGSHQFRLPQDADFNIVLYDMSDPDSPDEIARFTLQKDQVGIDIKNSAGKFNIKVEDGENLTTEGKDGAAKLTLGDGVVKAAIADHLETLWGLLKTGIDTHTHLPGSVPTGPTGPPVAPPTPAWDSNINSQSLLLPDN